MEISDLVYIDDTGYHYADYPTFRQYFVDKYQAIYGADTYLEDDSQDGQWISVNAQAAYDSAAQGASTYNSFSPISAQGVGLSRVVKINGIARKVPSYSTATVSVVGVAGTVITSGIVQDTLGQKWNLPITVTIPGGGTVDVTATSQVVGAITADAATITTVFTPARGWQTVTNAGAATPGAPVESDSLLRIRQQASVADPSLTVFDGTVGAVSNVAGVTKVRGYENDTGSTDAHSIPAHSICLVVAGGTNAAVAGEIELHKTPGTGTYGDTSTTVYDAHGMPNVIKFQRAVTATIRVRLTLAVHSGWSTDYEAQIQAAVAAVVNAGLIGDTVLYTKLFAPGYLNGALAGLTYDITTLELKKNAGAYAEANVSLDFDENPVCDPSTGITFIIT